MDRPLIGGSLRHVVGVDHYLRCENCLDHWSRFADLVVSDPWSADHLERETKGESAVLIRSARGQARVAAAVAAGALWAKPIPTEDMIGFNRHLWLRPEHERFSWMALYQLLFHKRLRFLPEIARRFFLAKLVGLRTTLRARFIKKYYY